MEIDQKQGIVTILGSDLQQNKLGSSLRRTLSADMSSKKWLQQNGVISPLKRIASSEKVSIPVSDHSSSSSSYDDDEDEDELEIIPTKLINNVSWSSLFLAEKTKTDDDSSNESEKPPPPPPYIHPLVKRSASALSLKSLEICTESLGSETGSDGFSPYPSSETSNIEEEKDQDAQEKQEEEVESMEELRVAKYNYNPCKKLIPRAFPPPLASIARGDGASIHMQSHRKNGRLVLEAVSVPQRNYFRAERQEGRLLLSVVNTPTSQEPCQEEMEDEVEEFGHVFDDNFQEIEKNHEEQEEEMEFVMEKMSIFPGNVMMMNGHKSGVVMKMLMRMDNINDPTWSKKLNKEVNSMVEGLTPPFPLSLSSPPPPPPPPTTTTTRVVASMNAYEYLWRKNPSVASIIDPIKDNNGGDLAKTYEQQELVVMRGINKVNYLVPSLRGGGCKESRRRSLLSWEPHCIPTS